MSNRATHWCYTCRRPIRLRGQDIICHNCNEGFVQEIREIGGMLNTYGISDPSYPSSDYQHRRTSIAEEMVALMRQRMTEVGRNRALDVHGTIIEQRTQPTVGPMLIFGSNTPAHASESSEVNVLSRGSRRLGRERPNFSGFLVGSGIDVLFDQLLLQENRHGAPPASQSAIDSMPVVKINRMHIRDDPHCAICTDKFEIGSEAREMSCKHLYHADCIIPWLVQHNSCPVCRHPLPSQSSGSTRSPPTRPNEAVSHGVTGADVGPLARSDDDRGHESLFLWPSQSSRSARWRPTRPNEAVSHGVTGADVGPLARNSDDRHHESLFHWPSQGSRTACPHPTRPTEAVSHDVTGADVGPVARSDDVGDHESLFLWPFGPSSADDSSYMYEGGVGELAVYDDSSQITSYPEWHYEH